MPVSQAKLRITDVGRDELVAIAPATHPWAGRKRIPPVDLAGQPLMIYDRSSQTSQLIERVLLEAGVFPQIAMEMDHLEAVTEMVRVGLGVAIVPRWAVRTEVERGEVLALPIGKSGLSRRWGLALLEANHRSDTLKGFARLCIERLPAALGAG